MRDGRHGGTARRRHDSSTWVDPPFVNGLHMPGGITANKDARGDTAAVLWRERPGTA